MATGRIYYVSRYFPYPLGGVRIAHHHVRLLVKNGFDAAILLRENITEERFFDTDVPTRVLTKNFKIGKGDVLVIPEPWNDIILWAKTTEAHRVVFCQNHFYIYHGIGAGTDYRTHGVDTVFCCSDVIRNYLAETLKLDRVPVVHNAVDHDVFHPGSGRKRIAVSYMPRKMKLESQFIRETMRRRHPKFARVPFIEIDGVPEAEVAAAMRKSTIFLSLARIDGLGLPPLEAMASGTFVVGFTGDGGMEYASQENGLWCHPEDWIGCADRLAEALEIVTSDPARYAKLVQGARRTAAAYTLERMERELIAFWTEELDRASSRPARNSA